MEDKVAVEVICAVEVVEFRYSVDVELTLMKTVEEKLLTVLLFRDENTDEVGVTSGVVEYSEEVELKWSTDALALMSKELEVEALA